MKKKIIVDIAMFILMLLEFSKGYLNPMWHELFGIVLTILFIIHIVLNMNYVKNIPKGDYSAKRSTMLFLNFGFLITFLLSIILGLLSSQEILKFLNMNNYAIMKLHKLFSYFSLIFLGLHLGINFNAMFGKITKLIKSKTLSIIISIILIIYGMYSFIKLQIFEHIIGIYDFGIIDGNLFVNIIRYLSVVIMLSIIMNYIYGKIPNKINKGRKIKEHE